MQTIKQEQIALTNGYEHLEIRIRLLERCCARIQVCIRVCCWNDGERVAVDARKCAMGQRPSLSEEGNASDEVEG